MREIFDKKLQAILYEKVDVYDEDHMFAIINTSVPKINIEVKRGQNRKGWGKLPFDYGELTQYINPSDNMGWDVIIAPDSFWNQPGLKVAGIVRYKKGTSEDGNDKIILAFGGNTTDEDKKILKNFFKDKKEFEIPEFFDTKSKLEEDKLSTTTGGWEAPTFRQYKLTRVSDDDYVGMGVGKVARNFFYGKKDENRRK